MGNLDRITRWSDLLTGAGLEAVHWSAIAAGNASDLEIMAFAKANDYIVPHTRS